MGVFPKQDLYDNKGQRTFDKNASAATFLLGGIGTGNFSIGARGELRDWEIFNSPANGRKLPYTFFAIWAKPEQQPSSAKLLEAQLTPPFDRHRGIPHSEIGGLPRFENSTMCGQYPFVNVALHDNNFPVQVSMQAFTPLIPLDADNSGLPTAIITYKVKNVQDKNVDVSLIGSFSNPVGKPVQGVFDGITSSDFEHCSHEIRQHGNMSSLHLTNSQMDKQAYEYGDMTISIDTQDKVILPYLDTGGWVDGMTVLWDDFCADGRFDANIAEYPEWFETFNDSKYDSLHTAEKNRPKLGAIGGYHTLSPGQEAEYQFIITWNFPIRPDSWRVDDDTKKTLNYYATLHQDSWETAKYVYDNYDMLYSKTRLFHDALFSSTLPYYVLDAVSANIDILRSNTCFRLKGGKFFGWEGCHEKQGSCEGNCTHVWNYQQTLAFLFPSLERDMRDTEFNVETDDTGKMEFRTWRLFGGCNNWHPAVDGQMGCIIRLYRDWKLCGDMDFLKGVWTNAKKALDFAFNYWDSDGDFVLDNQQHNTYDIEFYGPNSLSNSMFYGALAAGAKMAEAVGDLESSQKYADALAKGAPLMDEMLWNGEYYCQKIDDVNRYKYQYGNGCLSDQLLGQLNAHVAGLGYVLPEQHVKSAIKSVFDYNFLDGFNNHHSVQRTYALNDEKGLVLCTWPKGGRPKLPFVYSDEVWTGIEYQVATHLIYEGFIDEGLTVVKAVRDRHDGIRRNPWNEVECGYHYARAMASWGVLLALSGFHADLTENKIEFNPVINQDDFSCLFSCDKAWGVFRQKKDGDHLKYQVEVLHGTLEGIKVFANGQQVN